MTLRPLFSLLLWFPLLGCTSNSQEFAGPPMSLGLLVPMEGVDAPALVPMENGTSAALHMINAAGGIHGREVVLLTADSNSDSVAAHLLQGANTLRDAGVFAILGPSRSIEMLANWARDNTMLVVSGLATFGNTGPYSYAMTTGSLTGTANDYSAAVDANRIGSTQIVIATPAGLYNPLFNFGHKMKSLNPLADVNVLIYPRQADYTQWDPTPTVQAILAQHPDHVIFYNDNAEDIAVLIQGLKVARYAGVLGASAIGDIPANLTAASLGGFRKLLVGDRTSDSPEYQAYVQACIDWNGQAPSGDSTFALQSFDAATWVMLAAARAGVAGMAGGPALRDAMFQVMDPNALVVQTRDMQGAFSQINQGNNIYWKSPARDHRLNAFYEDEVTFQVGVCCDTNNKLAVQSMLTPADYK